MRTLRVRAAERALARVFVRLDEFEEVLDRVLDIDDVEPDLDQSKVAIVHANAITVDRDAAARLATFRARLRSAGQRIARLDDVAGGVDEDLVRIRILVNALDDDLGRAVVHIGRIQPGGNLAIAIAAWLLPARERGRYFEEYRGELRNLADAGTGWWQLNRHAIRLLVRAPALRVELKTARRRKAS